jgi:hypothetical protein
MYIATDVGGWRLVGVALYWGIPFKIKLGIYSKAFVGAVQRWQYMEMK